LKAAQKRQKEGSLLTARAQSKIAEQDYLSQFSKVQMATDTEGYVTSTRSGQRYRISLSTPECQCHWPFQFKLPCRHLIAAAKQQGLYLNNGAEAWYRRSVHAGYFLDTYIDLLQQARVALVNTSELSSKDPVMPDQPVLKRGRNTTKRIPSRGEGGGAGHTKKKTRCSVCEKVGHNKATCPLHCFPSVRAEHPAAASAAAAADKVPVVIRDSRKTVEFPKSHGTKENCNIQ